MEYRYVDIPVRLRALCDRRDTSLTGMGLDLQQPLRDRLCREKNMDIICGFGAFMSVEAASADGGPWIVTYLVFFGFCYRRGLPDCPPFFAPVAPMSKAARAIGETGTYPSGFPLVSSGWNPSDGTHHEPHA